MKRSIGALVLFLTVLTLVAYPVFLLLVISFNEQPYPGAGQFRFTLKNYAGLSQPFLQRALVNTLIYTASKTVIATAAATFISWLLVRTNIPLKRVIMGMILLPLPLPGLMIAIGLSFAFSPRAGVYNTLLRSVFNDPGLIVFNGYSMIGMITYGVIITLPLGLLIMVNAFRSVSAEMEEASKIAGSGGSYTFFKVTLPLVTPAVLVFFLLSIISGLQLLTGALFLGVPGGVRVLSLEVYNFIATDPPRYGPAAALSATLVVVMTGLLTLYMRATRMQGKYATIGGKGVRAKVIRLGPFRYILAVAFVTILSFLVLIPIGIVLVEPFRAKAGPYTWEDLSNLTLSHFRDVLTGTGIITGDLGDAVRTTIWAASAGALSCAGLALFVSYLKFRTNARGRDITYKLATYPMAVPAIVVSLTVLYATARTPIYGTPWAVVIAFVIHGLPYALALGSSVMFQIKPELEESARVTGASWPRTFFTILFPLLSSSYFAAVMFLLAQFVSTLEVVLLLRGVGVEFLSTMLFSSWVLGSIKWSTSIAVLMLMLTASLWLIAKLADRRLSRGIRQSTTQTQA